MGWHKSSQVISHFNTGRDNAALISGVVPIYSRFVCDLGMQFVRNSQNILYSPQISKSHLKLLWENDIIDSSCEFQKEPEARNPRKKPHFFAYCTTAEMNNQYLKAWEISMENPKSS